MIKLKKKILCYAMLELDKKKKSLAEQKYAKMIMSTEVNIVYEYKNKIIIKIKINPIIMDNNKTNQLEKKEERKVK